jgi:hypothetical protein
MSLVQRNEPQVDPPTQQCDRRWGKEQRTREMMLAVGNAALIAKFILVGGKTRTAAYP